MESDYGTVPGHTIFPGHFCKRCGSIVGDKRLHDNFHIELRNAASNAALANGRLDDIE